MQILKTLASNFAGEETLTNEAVEEGGKERRKTGKRALTLQSGAWPGCGYHGSPPVPLLPITSA